MSDLQVKQLQQIGVIELRSNEKKHYSLSSSVVGDNSSHQYSSLDSERVRDGSFSYNDNTDSMDDLPPQKKSEHYIASLYQR